MGPVSSRHVLARPASGAAGLWEASADALAISVAILDPSGTIVAVNAAWSAFAAHNGGCGVGVGANYLAACDAATDDLTAVRVARAIRAAAAGQANDFEDEYPCHSPREERWFSVTVRSVVVDDERLIVVAHQDITQRRTAERATREGSALLDAADAALIATDLDGNVTRWTSAAEQLYGWSAADALGARLADLAVGPADRAQASQIRHTVTDRGRWEGQLEVRRKDGSCFPAWVRDTLLRDDAGHPSGFVEVSIDISERVRNEQALRGTRDFLQTVTETMPDGMYVLDAEGRVLLMNPAAEAMLGWRSDELLGQVMHDITHSLYEDGTPHPIEDCAITRARLTHETVRVDSDVFVRRDGSLLAVAYSAAPCQMPDGGPGHVVVFNDISERRERERRLAQDAQTLAQVSRIREALDHERFVLYAQPIVDLHSGDVAHHELLIRMLDDGDRVIAPGAFLPVAEQTGLIREIDRYVIERGMRYAAAGHAVGLNVSAASLSDPYLTAFVEERLRHHGADPALLGFEITETALMEREDAAQAFVTRITQLGCAVALDDFGTGFGTFRYLKRLPARVLKIDREFVKDVTTDPASAHVVTTIVRLAAGMDKQTVAEGVEDEETLARLRMMGVDFAQGYLLGRPAPTEEALGRLG